MRSRLSVFGLVASLCVASPLSAQTHFTFVNGGTVTAFGYYVGAYNGTAGTGASQKAVVLNCVDFFHEVYFGSQWEANLSSLGTGAGVGTYTRESNINLYRQAAWLTSQYAAASNYDVGQIQATIWNLFQPAGVTASSNYWLTQAQNNYQTFDYSGYYVVTDVNAADPNSIQEFITKDVVPTTSTPEPTSMFLLGSGLIGLAGVRARRKQSRPT